MLCGLVTGIARSKLLTLGCARVFLFVSQFTKCVVYLDPEEFHTTWCAMDLLAPSLVQTSRNAL
jgi:hypothetical protein